MRLWDAFSNVMHIPRRRRIRSDEAEQLLATGHDPAHPELSRLLAAATAPPRPHELTGLPAALAAFEEAGRDERPAPAAQRRRRVLRPLAAASATAVVLAGGVAFAAETGYLPGTDPPPARESLAPREVPSSAARTSPGGGPARTSTPENSPTAGPAEMAKLCQKWEKRDDKGKPLTAKDLRELARVAGGEDRIPAFCAPHLRPTASPTGSAKHPDKKPGGGDERDPAERSKPPRPL